MRTVYLGTSEFAVAVLERLARSDHRPALVVTRPDRPKGRGRKLGAPPVAAAARELGIELDQPGDVSSEEARARIAAAEPEAVLVCAFGALLKEPLLSGYDMLNVHPSLLPRWRGARAGGARDRGRRRRDRRETSCAPPPSSTPDPAPDRRGADRPGRLLRLARAAAGRAGRGAARAALDSGVEPVEQPEEGATYAEKVSAEDRRLDPSRPAAELERKVRARCIRTSAPTSTSVTASACACCAPERGRGPAECSLSATGTCSPATSSCWRYSRPAGARWTPQPG